MLYFYHIMQKWTSPSRRCRLMSQLVPLISPSVREVPASSPNLAVCEHHLTLGDHSARDREGNNEGPMIRVLKPSSLRARGSLSPPGSPPSFHPLPTRHIRHNGRQPITDCCTRQSHYWVETAHPLRPWTREMARFRADKMTGWATSSLTPVHGLLTVKGASTTCYSFKALIKHVITLSYPIEPPFPS